MRRGFLARERNTLLPLPDTENDTEMTPRMNFWGAGYGVSSWGLVAFYFLNSGLPKFQGNMYIIIGNY